MRRRHLLPLPCLLPAALLACSQSDDPLPSAEPPAVDVRSLVGDAGVPANFVSFVDETTGLTTRDVYDANREVVRFDAARQAMVGGDTGAAVSGWVATGNVLGWVRSSIEFQVRFGMEDGERRAFFTEAVAGTICDLRLYGPDQLGISGTSELPPNP